MGSKYNYRPNKATIFPSNELKFEKYSLSKIILDSLTCIYDGNSY
jgi:hypothetical protein